MLRSLCKVFDRSVVLNCLAVPRTLPLVAPSVQNYVTYRSTELWKSVLSVSSQGSKKGRGKRRGASKSKDLNFGQTLGDGKMRVVWPGLNTDAVGKVETSIRIIGEDVDREKRLTELRNNMDKFKSITVFPSERGFTGTAISGKSIGEPVSYDDVDFSKFKTIIIDYNVAISHKSILGKKKVTTCFAITGNQDGIIGYGSGKAPGANGAIRLAKAHASQRLLFIDRHEDRTLFHNFYEEFYYTKLFAEQRPKGHGLVCHRVLKKLCELIGIKDLYCKVEGSRNPKNIVKAFLSGLIHQKKYEDIAKKTKLNVVEFKPQMNYLPVVLAKAPEDTAEQKKELIRLHRDNDLHLFMLGNKFRHEKKNRKPFYFEFPSYKRYLKQRAKDKQQLRCRMQRYCVLDDAALLPCYPPRAKPKPVEEEEAAE